MHTSTQLEPYAQHPHTHPAPYTIHTTPNPQIKNHKFRHKVKYLHSKLNFLAKTPHLLIKPLFKIVNPDTKSNIRRPNLTPTTIYILHTLQKHYIDLKINRDRQIEIYQARTRYSKRERERERDRMTKNERA